MSPKTDHDTSDDLKATRDFYIQSWRLLLKNLLYWPDEKIESWVKVRLQLWERNKSVIATKTPAYDVSFEIFSESTKEALNNRLVAIASKVEKAILDGDLHVEKFSASDWVAARERVNYVLSRCGTGLHLPTAMPR